MDKGLSSPISRPIALLSIIIVMALAGWPVRAYAQAPQNLAKEEAILRELDELYFFQWHIDARNIGKRVLDLLQGADQKLMPRVWLRGMNLLDSDDRNKYFDGKFEPLLQSALDLNDHRSYIMLIITMANTVESETPRREVEGLYAKARHSACEVLKDSLLCGVVWREEALYYERLNDIPACLTTLSVAISILEKLPGRARLYFHLAQNVLANALRSTGDNAKALNLYEENLEWYRNNGFSVEVSVTATNIANVLLKLEPDGSDKTKRYIEVARDFARQIQDDYLLANADRLEGHFLLKQANPDFAAAKRLFEAAFKGFRALNVENFAAACKISIAQALLGMGRIKEAWQAIAEADALLNPEFKFQRMSLLETKPKIAAAEGDYKAAYEHLQKYHDEWKLQKEEEKAKGLETLSANLTLKVEEERNKALLQENAAQAAELRTARLLLALGVLLMLVTAVAVRSTVTARRRNRLLIASQAKIKRILSTIDEGLLVVDEDGRIGADYSAHLEQIFDPSVPFAGEDFVGRIAANSRMPDEEVSMVREVLHAVLGEDRLAWDFNAENLPREMQLGENPGRTIELRWIPIFASDDVLRGLLVSLTDVTAKRALEETLGAQRKYIQALPDVLRELLAAEPGLTGRLLEKAGALISGMEVAGGSITGFQRDLHTHKGEARSLGLRALSQQLHALEAWLQAHAGHDPKDPLFISQLGQVRELILEYRSFADILHRETRSEGGGMPWLGTMLTQQLGSARQHLLGAELALAGIRLHDTHLAWTAEQMDVVHVFAIHALNNSMDHGFIIPRSRGEAITAPTLEITAQSLGGELVVEISDNGAGLNLDRLGRIARERGFVPRADETVADLVFYDGVSTAERVTESSGRGVGLAAVKADIERLGGRVGIRNHPEHRGTLIWARLPLAREPFSTQCGSLIA